MSLFAMMAQPDVDTQIKEETNKLVMEFGKQQQDEIDYRDECIDKQPHAEDQAMVSITYRELLATVPCYAVHNW